MSVRVLLVEDSKFMVAYIEGLLREDPNIVLLPHASDGLSGLAAICAERPDLVLIDLHLPGMHGLEVIQRAMAAVAVPMVVLSAYLDEPGRDRTFEALESGAVDVLAKPAGHDPSKVEAFRARLLRTVHTMSKARVVRRLANPPAAALPPVPAEAPLSARAVVVGASTGGPPVLYRLLELAPAPLRVPLFVCQHIVPGFEAGLAEWLSRTGHRCVVAFDGMPFEPGIVYLSPATAHLVLDGEKLRLHEAGAGWPLPSANLLFESAAAAFGAESLGMILTGMGNDGAAGLRKMAQAGAYTFAQSAGTCVVDGMPAAARAAGAVRQDATPEELGAVLRSFSAARLAHR